MAQILYALTFRPCAQLIELALLFPSLECFQKQARCHDHALAHRARGTLVMRKPLRKITCG
jgi:hypothetical protein